MDPSKIIGASWANVVGEEFSKPYMARLSKIVRFHRQRYDVFPPPEEVFTAFKLTPYEQVKVVILGQDPYPTQGHAHGLAFSFRDPEIPELAPIPKSLQNIFQEIENEYGFMMYQNPDLTRWARQGVLLLNTALTVVEGAPGSHSNIGWEQFIKTVILKLNRKENQLVYLLWGKHAQTYIPFIKRHHEYLTAPHPSPLSAYRGFFHCGHFKNCNEILKLSNQKPIDWTTDEIRNP